MDAYQEAAEKFTTFSNCEVLKGQLIDPAVDNFACWGLFCVVGGHVIKKSLYGIDLYIKIVQER